MPKNLRLKLFSFHLLFYFFCYSSFNHFSTLSGPLFSSIPSDSIYWAAVAFILYQALFSLGSITEWNQPCLCGSSLCSQSFAHICSLCCPAGVQGPPFREPFGSTVLSLPGSEQPGLPAESLQRSPGHLHTFATLVSRDAHCLAAVGSHLSQAHSYLLCFPLWNSWPPSPAGDPVVSQRKWELLPEPILYSWPSASVSLPLPRLALLPWNPIPFLPSSLPGALSGVGLFGFLSLNCFLPLTFKLVPISVFSSIFYWIF